MVCLYTSNIKLGKLKGYMLLQFKCKIKKNPIDKKEIEQPLHNV